MVGIIAKFLRFLIPIILIITLIILSRKWQKSLRKPCTIFSLIIGFTILGISRDDHSNTLTQEYEIQTSNTNTIQNLFDQPEWLDFRKHWQNLDTAQQTSESNFISFGVLDYAEYTRLRDELDNSLETLKPFISQGLLSQIEWDTLRLVTLKRIQFLYQGQSSLITRMIPTLSITLAEDLIVDMEQRIDFLYQLKESGDLDDELLIQGISNIYDSFYGLAVVETVVSNYGSYYFNSDGYLFVNPEQKLQYQKSRVSNYIRTFSEHYSNYSKSKQSGENNLTPEDYAILDEKYQSTLLKLEELRDNTDRLYLIVADLMKNKVE